MIYYQFVNYDLKMSLVITFGFSLTNSVHHAFISSQMRDFPLPLPAETVQKKCLFLVVFPNAVMFEENNDSAVSLASLRSSSGISIFVTGPLATLGIASSFRKERMNAIFSLIVDILTSAVTTWGMAGLLNFLPAFFAAGDIG